jgi:hypothetical protein
MTRTLTTLSLMLALTVLLGGCEEEGCEALDPDDAWALLGDGEAEAELLIVEDGATFQVERGSQGGMHVWVAIAVGDIHPGPTDLWEGLRSGELPKFSIQLEGPHGVLTPENVRPQVLERGDGEYLLLHQQIQFRHFELLPDNWQDLDYAEVEADMETQDHLLRVRIEDACGTIVEDELPIRLSFPERPGANEETG